jgi:hypothetical protein
VKTCKKCGEEKPLGQFRLNASSSARPFREGVCKACVAAAKKLRWATDPGFKERQKTAQRKMVYGITQDRYQKFLQAQEGRCEICQKIPKVFCVDHCHTTGKIRGLLCKPCNMFLGRISDSPEAVLRVTEYLKK